MKWVGEDFIIHGHFVDSDWGTDAATRRSIYGQITRFNKTPISWRS